MSRQASVLIPSSSNISAGGIQSDFTQSVLATAVGTAIVLGKNRIFAFVCEGTGTGLTGGVNIAFYNSLSAAVTPTAAYFFIPYGQIVTFDLGPENDTVNFFNPAAAAASIWIKVLSVN